MVGYSETDATATALGVEFVGQSVSGRERIGEECLFGAKFAGVRDEPATGAERGMLHGKRADTQNKDGHSPALETGNLFRTLAPQFRRRWNALHIFFYLPGFPWPDHLRMARLIHKDLLVKLQCTPRQRTLADCFRVMS